MLAISHKPLRLEWIDPADLEPNGLNFRTHPPAQVAALAGVIEEVGWAGALLYNERTKRLIDGHARRDLFANKGVVPVLVGDWSEEDERKILATLDPISAIAGVDTLKLEQLLADVTTGNEAVASLLDQLAHQHGIGATEGGGGGGEGGGGEQQVSEQFQVLVILKSEAEQAKLLSRLAAEGYEVRSLIS